MPLGLPLPLGLDSWAVDEGIALGQDPRRLTGGGLILFHSPVAHFGQEILRLATTQPIGWLMARSAYAWIPLEPMRLIKVRGSKQASGA